MADTFTIEVATPERLLAREQAVRAQIPAKEGYIGVLPGHAALLSELGIGAMTFMTPQDHQFSMAIKGGYLEILNDTVRVLTDEAEQASEINVGQAEKDLRDAQNAMINPSVGADIASALTAAQHAQARIDAARKAAHKEE